MVAMRQSKLPLLAIAFTVFLDILAFGMMIPDIQLRVRDDLGLDGIALGLVLALFSIVQFIVAPVLGRLSDRIGRRKILIITTVLATLGGFAYAFADTIAILCLARVLQGAAAANIGVAYAYITDVTDESERAGSMGFLGAAFGLGFVFGPPLGAFLLGADGQNLMLLGMSSAVLSALNVIFVLAVLKESKKNVGENLDEFQAGPIRSLVNAFKIPNFGLLLLLFFVANFAMSNMESTWFLLTKDVYFISKQQGALLLTFVGIVIAVVQGAFVGPLSKRFGELKLMRFGYLLTGPSLVFTPLVPVWIPVLLVCAGLATGSALSGPTLQSIISKSAPIAIIGGTFGLTQSLGAIARILGPMIGNSMYAIDPWVPYAFAGALTLIPLALSFRIKRTSSASDPSAVS